MVEPVRAEGRSRVPDGQRASIRLIWRWYALCALVPMGFLIHTLIGPNAQRPFEPLMAVDFGAFYSGAMLVSEDRAERLGDMEAQRDAQRRLQEREDTGWRWYNALPHPPVTSLLTSPLALLPLRTAYWLWTATGLGAAFGAAWLLARTLVPTAIGTTTLILVSFEPIWDVAWWGQIDTLLLLLVAAGLTMLFRRPEPGRDLAAGALLGALALKPIFVPVVLLTLLWGRRAAALGLILTSAVLAIVSAAMVGLQGIKDYVDLARYYQQFSGSPAIVEWRMFNLRGLAIRLGLDGDGWIALSVTLAISLLLAAASIAIAGEALRRGRSLDLAIALLVLGMVLTAYHVHVQSLVFLTIPLAVWIGRSLAATSRRASFLWMLPVLMIHGGAFLLKPEQPSPSPSEARLETLLTIACLSALVGMTMTLAAKIINAAGDSVSTSDDQPTNRTASPSAAAT